MLYSTLEQGNHRNLAVHQEYRLRPCDLSDGEALQLLDGCPKVLFHADCKHVPETNKIFLALHCSCVKPLTNCRLKTFRSMIN